MATTSNTPINRYPFLKTSREFPNEINDLANETNFAYIDIANAVNDRVISLFPTTRPAINGEAWFLTAVGRQNGLRQVYTFNSTAAINHGIDLVGVERFVRIFGTYTDGTNWYGLLGGSSVAIAGQVSVYVTPTQILFLTGAGAPTVSSGEVILEWITFP